MAYCGGASYATQVRQHTPTEGRYQTALCYVFHSAGDVHSRHSAVRRGSPDSVMYGISIRLH